MSHDDVGLGEVAVYLDRRPFRGPQGHGSVRRAVALRPARQDLAELALHLLVGDVAHGHENGAVGAVVAPVKVHHRVPVQAPDRVPRAFYRAAVEAAGVKSGAERFPGDGPRAVALGPDGGQEGLLRAVQLLLREGRLRQHLAHERQTGVQVLLEDAQAHRGQFAAGVGPEVGAHALDQAADGHGVARGGAPGQEPGGEVGQTVPVRGIVARAGADQQLHGDDGQRGLLRGHQDHPVGKNLALRVHGGGGDGLRRQDQAQQKRQPAFHERFLSWGTRTPTVRRSRSRYSRATRWTSSAVTPWMPFRYSFMRRHPPVTS